MSSKPGVTYTPIGGKALDRLRVRMMQPVDAVPTPWAAWSSECKGWGGEVGFARGWHILVAGRSGGAKTFTALNMAATAIAHGESVTFHSLEMGWDEVASRVLAIVSGVDAWKIAPGRNFDPGAYDQARSTMDQQLGTLLVNEDPMFKLPDLLAGIERTHEEHGSQVHIVDYMQLAWTGDASSMYDRITEVSHAVRSIAKRLRVVTVGLSQLNRETSKLGAERPMKEGMIGGSSLENDADQVLLLDHSRRADATKDGRIVGWIGWANLDKNRHGPQVDIPIRFDRDTFRIRQRLDDEILPGEIPTPKGSL